MDGEGQAALTKDTWAERGITSTMFPPDGLKKHVNLNAMASQHLHDVNPKAVPLKMNQKQSAPCCSSFSFSF